MEERQYEIGGTTYIQRPLVLGQTRQLLDVLKGITFPGELDARSLLEALGASLPAALAVVLTEKGKSPKNKDLDALAAELDFSISLDQVMQVIDDFFTCNPLPSLLDKLTRAAGSLSKGMMIPSRTSASSSPAETSAAGTGSSGDSHLTSAGPGSKAEGEMSSSGNP